MTLPPLAEFQVCPRGEDVLDKLVLRAEAEVEKLGWGGEREAPLRWFWIYDNGKLADGMASVALGRGELTERLKVLHPLELIQLTGRYMTKVDRKLIGFILVSEGWMVTWKSGDVLTADRAVAAAARGEIWRQPDRVETRTAMLQMLGGQSRFAVRIRGQEPRVLPALPPAQREAGEIPAALGRLANTLRLRKFGRRG